MPDVPATPDADPDRLVTAKDGAFLTGVPLSRLNKWVAAGYLVPAAKVAIGNKGRANVYRLGSVRRLAAGYHARKAERASKGKVG